VSELTNEEQTLVAEARTVCEKFIRDFDSVTLETKPANAGLLQIAVAWAKQVHRFVQAALLLIDNGFGHEALVLQRQALEFTVRLHWLTKVGDAAVDTVLADHQNAMNPLAMDASDGPIAIPEELLAKLGGAEIDDKYAYGSFREACEALGVVDSLYSLYRHLSKYAHPTWSAATFYMEPQGSGEVIAFRTKPPTNWDHAPVMLAALVIWSTRSVDDLLIGKPRRRALQQAARKIRAKPALPYLQKPPRTKTKKKTQRRRASGGKGRRT
jgi:hypothetical protein